LELLMERAGLKPGLYNIEQRNVGKMSALQKETPRLSRGAVINRDIVPQR